MKLACLSLLLLTAPSPTSDDAPTRRPTDGVPVQLGFYLPYGTQPGVRAGVPVELVPRDKTLSRRRGPTLRTSSLTLGPQLAFFTRPGNHWSLLAQAEVGYKLFNHRSGLFSSFGLGLGYRLTAQIVTERVDLATGQTSAERDFRHHVLPELAYTLGQEFDSRWGWFFRTSAGLQVSPQVDRAVFVSLQLGVSFRIPTGGAE